MRHPSSLDETLRMDAVRPVSGRGRRILLAVFLAAVVGALASSAVFSAGEEAPVAQLRIREPTVEVQHADEDFETATEGAELEVGDVVRTNAGGRAQVDYFEGSLTRLDVFSELSVRRLVDEPGNRLISMGLNAGRIWNRVTTPTADAGRFEVHFQNAVASVEGTTFVTDCSRDLHCYVLGIADTTRVEVGDQSESVNAGQCVDLVGETLQPCDAAELGLIDDWIKQNLAEDQQLEVSATPSPSPSPSPSPRPRAVVRPPATPTPTPTPTPSPTPTKTPKPTAPPLTDPPASPTPTPTPSPTAAI